MNQEMNTKWIPCPECQGNTRTKVRQDTSLYHHLIFCPKCKKEYLVNVDNFNVTIVQEPDAKTQSNKSNLEVY